MTKNMNHISAFIFRNHIHLITILQLLFMWSNINYFAVDVHLLLFLTQYFDVGRVEIVLEF